LFGNELCKDGQDFFVITKAEFSDDSELSELKSSAGDGKEGKQICAGYFRTSP
jgi:hypothetical protein